MAELEGKQLLDKLQFITEDAISRLETMDSEALEALAAQRQALVTAIEPYRHSINEVDREQIAYILKFDALILARMNSLKNEAAEWMQKQGTIRTQQSAYQHGYAMNSMFIDHRK
ncbi:hypothetical protein [Saccharibacillus kuerlensis]|uniref:Flagellar protein FliT n=1 Tax=Saccharibacillus kuerlensis TaxID=459527 RepID=A0ABQ2KTU0_9BACL|nr:hypothetical protein [Saccharibacillus kuerlensis]GGN93213.1 hypothetical protein GCM10010969_06540 [Saccharibacillus kuerlensis]